MNYILYGNDESRAQIKIDELKKKHRIDTPIVYIDASVDDPSYLFAELDSYSLFDDQKMVVVKNSSFLSSKNTTKYDLKEIVKRDPENLVVVYWYPGEKLDKRRKNVKLLMEKSQCISCLALDARSQPGYIRELCEAYHVQMNPEALKWFSARVGMNSLKIEKEVEKLSIYSKHIGLEDVKALVCIEPADNVFKMTNALFEKNGLLLLSYYRNFRGQNMETVAIIALLASQIRFLYQVSVYMNENYTKEEIVSALKAHPYRVQVSMQNARRFSCDELLGQLSALSQLDYAIKSGQVDKDEGFEQFALRLIMNQ